MSDKVSWLSRKEVAARLGLSEEHTRRLLVAGVIPSKRIPPFGMYRIDPKELERFEDVDMRVYSREED